MSLFSAISDFLFTDTSKTQTYGEATANYERLQKELAAQGRSSNGGALQDPGAAANEGFLRSLTFQDQVNAPDGGDGPGIGSVIGDLFVIALIGAGIWAFAKFGGTDVLKSVAKKNKYYAAAIIGAVVLILFLIYRQFKKTASDSVSTAGGILDGLKAINPFA